MEETKRKRKKAASKRTRPASRRRKKPDPPADEVDPIGLGEIAEEEAAPPPEPEPPLEPEPVHSTTYDQPLVIPIVPASPNYSRKHFEIRLTLREAHAVNAVLQALSSRQARLNGVLVTSPALALRWIANEVADRVEALTKEIDPA